MIYELYIMRTNGILLYDYSRKESESALHKDILAGFFASIANFSKEALRSAIENVALGSDRKVIIVTDYPEKLLATAIVSAADNDATVKNILNTILQQFIDLYSPNYIAANVNREVVDKIVEKAQTGKILDPPSRRIMITALILAAVSPFIMLFTAVIAELMVQAFGLTQIIVSSGYIIGIILQYLPIMFFIGTMVILMLFILPNLLIGYFCADRKMALVFSVLFIIFMALGYAMGDASYITILILSYLPLVLIVSIYFINMGIQMAYKNKLVP